MEDRIVYLTDEDGFGVLNKVTEKGKNMKLKRIYSRPTLDVKDLLGKNLVHYIDGKKLVGKIVKRRHISGLLIRRL